MNIARRFQDDAAGRGLGLAIALSAAAWIAVAAAWRGRSVQADTRALGPAPALPDMRVDLNRAAPSELVLLPGIGPAMAGRIAADRASRGGFDSVDGLRRVRGIGPATVERLRPYAVVEQDARDK